MPQSHYLPAAYLGGLSTERGPRRDRRVWVLRRGASGPTLSRASKILRVRDLYSAEPSPGIDLERHWQGYEDVLPAAIASLTSGGPLDALTWLHVLVPWVTGTLLRGPEFERRFRGRLVGLEEWVEPWTINGGRLIEFQRLLAPVLTAHWVVLHSPDVELITSDIGWVHASVAASDSIGVGVVLGPRHILMLAPEKSRPVALWHEDRWLALFERGTVGAEEATALNRLQAGRAERLIVGASSGSVAAVTEALEGPRIQAPEPLGQWGIDPWVRVVHEFEWWRLARALRRQRDDITDFDLDFSVAKATGWWPIPVLPVNLPEFASGLAVHGPVLALTLNDQPRSEPPDAPDEPEG